MANRPKISLRHIQIDKANTIIFVSIAVAAACLVFSLVSLQALWRQAGYNRKVISAKEKSVSQLEQNIQSLDQLNTSYQAFVGETSNIIGGSSTGQGDKDGDNAKITLDALPSVYDFPGLVSGMNKILTGRTFTEATIDGVDDEIAQISNSNTAPAIVEIPLSFSAKGGTEAAQDFLNTIDNSIRPVKLSSVSFGGSEAGDLEISATGMTYYQPKKVFQVKKETIQ